MHFSLSRHKNSLLFSEGLKVSLTALVFFASSQIAVPMYPVPMTLQTLVLMMIGLTYTPREILLSVGLWLTAGALGAPVFACFSGGLSVFMGPTGGYLVGLLLAPFVMSLLRKHLKLQGFWSMLALATFGDTLLFGCGVLWLAQFTGAKMALQLGALPFALGELFKIGLATQSARSFQKHF